MSSNKVIKWQIMHSVMTPTFPMEFKGDVGVEEVERVRC
jgi:hypothetical protein